MVRGLAPSHIQILCLLRSSLDRRHPVAVEASFALTLALSLGERGQPPPSLSLAHTGLANSVASTAERQRIVTCTMLPASGKNLFHDFSFHVGQAEISALEAKRQLRVIETEQVQDRGVQVVDVDFVLHDVETQL